MSNKDLKVLEEILPQDDVDKFLTSVVNSFAPRIKRLIRYITKAEEVIFNTEELDQGLTTESIKKLYHNYDRVNRTMMEALEFIRKVSPNTSKEGDMELEEIAHKLSLLPEDNIIELKTALRKLKINKNES